MDNKRKAWHVSNIEIKCNKCKKHYKPDTKCISIKNPNYYYKTCRDCREYIKEFIHNRDHLHYKNYQPSLFQ